MYGSPTVARNAIQENSALLLGGGIFVSADGTDHILENTILGNLSATGGGLCIYHGAAPLVSGNLVGRNTATEVGGGVVFYSLPQGFRDNTIVGNEASLFGGGIFTSYTSPLISNTILWGNSPDEIYPFHSSPIFSYCDVEKGWPGKGNIDADPSFVFPGWDDHRLLSDSPCIDRGDPTAIDPDGTRSDIGAFSFDQRDSLTLYLSPEVLELAPGGECTMLYTLINRWQPGAGFWFVSRALLPSGGTVSVIGPTWVDLPGNQTAQVSRSHLLPPQAPFGLYRYRAGIGLPPDEILDADTLYIRVGTK